MPRVGRTSSSRASAAATQRPDFEREAPRLGQPFALTIWSKLIL